MSKRQEMIDALKAAMTGYTEVNGYSLTVRAVKEDEGRDYDPKEYPLVVIKDGECQVTEADFQERKTAVAVTLLLEGGADLRQRLRTGLSEMYKIIGNDETLGGATGMLTPKGDNIEVVFGTEKVGAATVFLDADYETDMWED